MPRNSKPRRPASGTVHVNGHTATRTRKAQSPRSKRTVRELQQAHLRQTCFEMQLQYVSQTDIAKSLGISRPRVSQLLNAEYAARDVTWNKTAAEWREQECARIEQFLSKWSKKAETNPRAADVLRSWAERRDRILGLYTQHHELSVGMSGKPSADDPPYDMRRLTDAQFDQLQSLLMIAAGVAPEPAPVYETVIAADWNKMKAAPAQAQIEDHSIVAEQPADESLRDRILKLHGQGIAASAIAETLGITRSALIAALENTETIQ